MSEESSAKVVIPEELTDRDLLERIQKRDQEALTRFFERYSKLVYSIAFKVLRDSGRAEDVLQEVFMQVWKKPIALDQVHGSLGAYLAVSARNRSVDLIRRSRPTVSAEEVRLPSPENLGALAERKILLQRIREVAANFPVEQRSALELAFFEGHTHTEIAEMTGTPLGTVKTRIRSALQLLERALR